ncbi:tetratricopeptide repeat protein [Streptomyces sp. TRM 70361]|uniref:tetratricopeptide repeat protein n=1 Tax=Streptomyces sp. TRM 70361 TaxID=3116553 RepID=UPI002E7B237F|nr:tetratricopeptide repeat protein [Streptomyces sp. TRM 70361]MEE1942660.1 tetratricopeptide repeat protein [Streptomyces sp. TRM 70361]
MEIEPADAVTTNTTGIAGSPAALLRARRQVVPFRGRTELLAELRAWTGEPGFGALLLHGPGGQGKTRLAQHLADALAAEGRATLWLGTDADSLDDLPALSAATAPALIVADHAETRAPQVTALLNAVVRHGGGYPLKLLMLARTASDWWQVLQAAEDLLGGAGTVPLPALEPDPGDSRVEAYRGAVYGYAAHLSRVCGRRHHNWLALADRLAATRTDLPGLETALSLHMTALADLLDTDRDPDAAVGDRPAEDVEDRLLRHEHRYWSATAAARGLRPALTMETLTDALAAAFLLGAEDRAEADTLLRRVPGLADQPEDRRGAVRDWIAALHPAASATRPWGSLRPDRLAERFVGRRLENDPALADHLVPGTTGHQAARLLTVCTRAAAHPVFGHRLAERLTALCVRHANVLALPAVDVATQAEVPRPLIEALHQITDDPRTPLHELEDLVDRLPDAGHTLALFAFHLTRLVISHYRVHVYDSAYLSPDFAMRLNNLSNRLGELGRREEALEAITEAVQTYRELTQEEPDTFLPDLATSLNNLSNRLGELGRREEALEAITEAVQTYRELTREQPDTFLPRLATSLNNLSVDLGELGRQGEALTAITEAVGIRRTLARKRPRVHQSELDRSLHVLAWLRGEDAPDSAG